MRRAGQAPHLYDIPARPGPVQASAALEPLAQHGLRCCGARRGYRRRAREPHVQQTERWGTVRHEKRRSCAGGGTNTSTLHRSNQAGAPGKHRITWAPSRHSWTPARRACLPACRAARGARRSQEVDRPGGAAVRAGGPAPGGRARAGGRGAVRRGGAGQAHPAPQPGPPAAGQPRRQAAARAAGRRERAPGGARPTCAPPPQRRAAVAAVQHVCHARARRGWSTAQSRSARCAPQRLARLK